MPGFVRERVHFERPVSPLFATLVLPAIERGYRLASLARGGEPGAIVTKVVDGYVYTGWEPLDAPAPEHREIPDLVDEWEKERIPEARRLLAEILALASPGAADKRVAGELTLLAAKLERLYTIHYEAGMVARAGASMLEDALRERGDAEGTRSGRGPQDASSERADLSVATLLAPCDSLLRDIDAWLAEGAPLDAPVWADARLRPTRVDLAAPTWGEEPALARRAAAASDARAFREGTERALARRAEAEARALDRFPVGAHDSVRFVLDALRRARGLAQTLNFLAGEAAIGATRLAMLRVGERIDADPFGYTLEELRDALLEGNPPVSRSYYTPQEPPDTIGDVSAMLADPRIASMLGVATRGIGASPGIAEGSAHVVRDEADLDDLQAGEILVVAVLEPSWTPAMQRAAGIVAERGGILSHAAVVAREMGKPAVVGVTGATRRLRSGERMRIDGTTGAITFMI